MWKRTDTVNLTGNVFLGISFNSSNDIIDAAYRWNNPDLITDTDTSVFSAITLKEFWFFMRKIRNVLIICISKQISKSGF